MMETRETVMEYAVFELQEQIGTKRHDDSVESHGYLSSSIDDLEDEDDEYEIISCCDVGSVVVDSYTEVNTSKYETCKEETNVVDTDEVIPAPDRKQMLGNMRLPPYVSNSYVEISPRPLNKEAVFINSENDRDEGNLYMYGITSTPNKEYEMKILAGPTDISELILSPDRDVSESTAREVNGAYRLRQLSTRMRRSFDEAMQNNKDEVIDDIPLEDIRHREIVYQHNLNNDKVYPGSGGLGLKNEGVSTEADTHAKTNLMHSKSMGQVNTYPGTRFLGTTYDVDSQPRVKLSSSQIYDIEDELLMEEIKEDSFVEIDDDYSRGHFVYNCECDPVELEMQTIFYDALNDSCEVFPTVTEFINPEHITILRRGEVTCRYISIFRQEKCNKYITVAFVNVAMPKARPELDVPCEEIIEEIYSYCINELVIYEDEVDLDIRKCELLPSIYDDWVLL